MKQKIRNGVFETNSSSCHSLCLSYNTDNLYIPSPDDGIIEIPIGEFGWELYTYYGFYDKAAYVSVYIRDWSGDVKNKRKIFEDIIKEYTQCDEVKYADGFWENKSWDNGYIDHQSVEDRDLDFLFENTNELVQLLFNRNSYIQTDNDNR